MRAIRNCYESLTPREREVMALVVSGLLNKQVGGELGISEITVKAHRGQVMRKMKADSLPDLVTMAARLGLRPAPATLTQQPFPAPAAYLRRFPAAPLLASSNQPIPWYRSTRCGVPTHPSSEDARNSSAPRPEAGGPGQCHQRRHTWREALLTTDFSVSLANAATGRTSRRPYARARDRRVGGRDRNRSREVPAWRRRRRQPVLGKLRPLSHVPVRRRRTTAST